jgi:antitoxin component YwqK of YwqJK toxin-antitoxin module
LGDLGVRIKRVRFKSPPFSFLYFCNEFSIDKMNFKAIAVGLLLGISFHGFSQTDQSINKTDKDGKKQGHWIKKYPNGNIMYDGYFANDKPTGEFKRFYEDKPLKSVLIFSKDGKEAIATLYYPNGLVASTGKYVNQLKEGKWRFFSVTSNDILISEVEYSGDKKNGPVVKYYSEGKVAEKLFYKNDLKHGECLKYYPDGTLTLKTNYINGNLDGKFEAFFENGRLEMLGQYKDNLREGPWIIYKKDGSLRFKTEYVSGVPDNRNIDIYQSDYIDSLERNKVRIADPEKTGEIW